MQKDLRKKVQSLRWDLRESERTHNSYEQERREQACVRRGDVEGLHRAIGELEQQKVGRLHRDDLRNFKDLAIVVITLSSRSSIEGGVSPEKAFSMSDAFIQRIEEQRNLENVMELCRKAELEFCLAVRDEGRFSSKNPIIVRCRDLINRRINTKITIQELAEVLNTSPDYLSALFSREAGVTLSDFIAMQKVRAASRALVFTKKSYDEIAAELSYASQSHFGKVFKKWTGMTPRQYRMLYGESGKE